MHAQLRSLYPLSTLDAAHVRKNTRLSLPAQLPEWGSLGTGLSTPKAYLSWVEEQLQLIISGYYDDYKLLVQYSQLATGWDIFVRINNNHAYNIIAHPHGSAVLQGIGNKNATSLGLKPKELGNKSC